MKKVSVLFAIVVIAVMLVMLSGCNTAAEPVRGPATGADWPNFLGPSRNGLSVEKGINKNWNRRPPAELWRSSLTGKGFSGPAVADGKLYLLDHMDDDDVLRVFDASFGKAIWNYVYPNPAGYNYGWSQCTPAIHEGKVYLLSCLGVVQCVDTTTRGVVWQTDIMKRFGGKIPRWRVAMSPVIDGDRVVLIPGGPGATLVALHKETGKLLWKGGGSFHCSYATPAVATIGDTRQYVLFCEKQLVGVHSDNGNVLWQIPWKTHADENVPTPSVAGDSVFVSSMSGCARARVSGTSPRMVWKSADLAPHFSSPILYEGALYGIDMKRRGESLVCLDHATGRALWMKGGFDKGGLAIVDNAIVAMGKNCIILAEATKEEYRQLGRIAIPGLTGRLWTAPVIAGGKLFVRNEKILVCLDLK